MTFYKSPSRNAARCPTTLLYIIWLFGTFHLRSQNLDISPIQQPTEVDPTAHDSVRPPIPDIAHDDLYQLIQQTGRYFVVISAYEYPDPIYNRPFAKTAGEMMTSMLQQLGYKNLLDEAPYKGTIPQLSGSSANRANIQKAMGAVADQPPQSVVVIYYVGHGVVSKADSDDVLLSTADTNVSDKDGILLHQLISWARDGDRYQGRLVMILDACHSGQGLTNQNLWKESALSGTVVLTAVKPDETSERLLLSKDNAPILNNCAGNDPKDIGQTTALAYFTKKGLTDDWEQVDPTDGIISYQRLGDYLNFKFAQAKADNVICAAMSPKVFDFDRVLLAYNRDKIIRWNSPLRQSIMVARTSLPPQKGQLLPTNVSSIVYKAGDKVLAKVTPRPGSLNGGSEQKAIFQIPASAASVTALLLDKDSKKVGELKFDVESPSILSPDALGTEGWQQVQSVETSKKLRNDPLMITVTQSRHAE